MCCPQSFPLGCGLEAGKGGVAEASAPGRVPVSHVSHLQRGLAEQVGGGAGKTPECQDRTGAGECEYSCRQNAVHRTACGGAVWQRSEALASSRKAVEQGWGMGLPGEEMSQMWPKRGGVRARARAP